ncbi:hypothetical protein [Nostoc sp.]|uniref:hypothetical protein n=1 Tax=Nostoc sp. TaxID=1180 RepID=UPI002FF7C504
MVKSCLLKLTILLLPAFGGTSFRSANLTDANFTAGPLKSMDFRKASQVLLPSDRLS